MTSELVFKKVALIGRQRTDHINETLVALESFLCAKNIDVIYEKETANLIPADSRKSVAADELGKHCDLIIAVGGDGSLLKAARIAVKQNLPVLGINRGRLGFLTDIRPEEFEKVNAVLHGEYTEEKRFLLTAQICDQNKIINEQDALNDVVLFPGAVAHMLEFSIHINQRFVATQRADGLIIATPTGSTAYALSGGGPILQPGLDAIELVPMFPHTLSNRPLVILGDSIIEILIGAENEAPPTTSCDGQARIEIPIGGKINVFRKKQELRLIHPNDYHYFETLRTKLGWSGR